MENDPVFFVRRFGKPEDIEIAGFIASQFAYGRVQQVMSFLARLFSRMNGGPFAFVASGDFEVLSDLYYRFHKGADIMRLFAVLRNIAERYGGIGPMIERFYEGDLREAVWTARAAVIGDSDDLLFFFPRRAPASTFKRWSLYARWMVRRDDIDLGLWRFIDKRDLVVPLDANIFKIGRCFGWTDQKTQNWKAARQITEKLKAHCPEDPLKYDFFLCHVVGIGGGCGGTENDGCAQRCLLHEI